jgi:hypothetical protein
MTPRPKERLEERSDGLVVVRYEMTKEQKKQRRADNRAMKLSRELHRASKKHGQRSKKKLAKVTPTFKDAAKAKHKAKRNDAV